MMLYALLLMTHSTNVELLLYALLLMGQKSVVKLHSAV
jgi:hypothetical protein